MTRILHLVPETGAAGAETQARYLLSGLLMRQRWNPELAYFRRGQAHVAFELLGLPLHHVAARWRLPVDWPRRVRSLWSLAGETPPQIVHSWLFEANAVAMLAAWRWPGTRVVISQRAGAAERESVRIAATMRLLGRRADHAIANSQAGLELLHERGFHGSRVSLIPNGIPIERTLALPGRTEARSSLGLDESAAVVGYVGRVGDEKDIPTLFGAMEKVWELRPSTRLVLVGPRPDEIEDLTVARPERVEALGWHAEPLAIVPAFDVLALSSWSEGHSNAVAEAMLVGVPVATTSAGDHPRLVAETGGKVVPIRRPDLLGAAILDLILERPDRAAIASRAASLVSMEPVLDAVEQLYERLLAEPRAR